MYLEYCYILVNYDGINSSQEQVALDNEVVGGVFTLVDLSKRYGSMMCSLMWADTYI